MGMTKITRLTTDGYGNVVNEGEFLVDDTGWPRSGGDDGDSNRLVKREVSDETFRLAWYGGPDEESQKAASDNQGILRAIRRRFRSQLDEDECESCAMVALWKTLQCHQPVQKFTTSLHRFAMWEFLKAVKKKERVSESNMDGDVLPLIERHAVDEHDTWSCSDSGLSVDERRFLSEMIEQLPYSWQKQIIREYYLNERSHDLIGFINGGYSKETSRLKLDQALAELKYIIKKSQENSESCHTHR